MTLSFQVYQPYAPQGYARGSLIYDPRGDSFPYLYSQSATVVSRLHRRTGVIDVFSGQFDSQGGSFGPADMDTAGNLWWIGEEPANLTAERQAQTKFAADTLAKIGSLTSDGVTILYPHAGQVRVDRHSSSHLVWQIDQSDIHSNHGNLYAWDGTTRILSYFLDRTTWYDQPTGGVLNRVTDIDCDGNGNLWCVTLDDSGTYILLWKVTPAGTQTMVTNLTATFAGNLDIPMIRWVAADNSLVIGAANKLAKCQVSDGAVIATGTAPVYIEYGKNYQSFHHTIDSTSMYLCATTGPVFHEINLLDVTTTRSIDFTGVSGVVGTFFNGFNQTYDAPRQFAPVTALYDPILGGVWCEEFLSGVIGAFLFDEGAVRTTQIIAEVFIRPQPQQPQGPSSPIPPPIFFTPDNILQKLTGPALPMEICGGYIGHPVVKSQLQKIRANYTTELAPATSQLLCLHTEQIGEADVEGKPGVYSDKTKWFSTMNTNHYHRVCLVCTGDTETVSITYQIREAGSR